MAGNYFALERLQRLQTSLWLALKFACKSIGSIAATVDYKIICHSNLLIHNHFYAQKSVFQNTTSFAILITKKGRFKKCESVYIDIWID